MKKIFKNRLFMSSLTADMISNFGDVLFYLALMNYVLLLPDAKYAIALITILEKIPTLTDMFTGYFADKTKNKMNMIIVTLVFRIFAYLGVGFVIGFDPALWIVVVIAFINLLSDFAGQYENGLFIPISLKIVSDEDRQEFMAFKQTVGAVTVIAFQAISASLVIYLSYQTIALVNALTFFIATCIMLLIYKSVNKLIKVEEKEIEEVEETSKKEKVPFWQDFKTKAVLTYKSVKDHSELFTVLAVLPFFNGLFMVFPPLVVLIISENSDFVIVNSATTIAVVSISAALASIVGSILGMNLFKELKIMTALKLVSLFAVGLFISFYLQNIYMVLSFVVLTIIMTTTISPKFSALVMNTLDKNNMALIIGFLNSYLQSGILLVSFSFSLLVVLFNSKVISLIFLLLSILLVIYVVKPLAQNRSRK